MKVLPGRLLIVLDEVHRQRRPGGASPMCSARSTGSSKAAMQGAAEASRGVRPLDSARSGTSACTHDSESEECTAFDLLHTKPGFLAFTQWYVRQLPGTYEGRSARRPDLGLLWPQAYCAPHALHEYAFVDFLRLFVDCTDREALDFFDLLDSDCLGALTLQQVCIAVLLIAALGSRQLTKCLYVHSKRLFGLLSTGSQRSLRRRHVLWPRVQMLMQLLGAPWHLISRVCSQFAFQPLAKLTHDDFVEVMFPVTTQLDRGASDLNDYSQVINTEKVNMPKSRACVIL
eukprot:TRINITY_DN75931_c0_g1_i1.p1 TRINITY_DN75931_c0_g1~~TRINITY_DN75931_c0_g1_i1.p1  ORF type:complete len:287 (+),score=36.46 TRINITY_DN75931_c0_g1_i1:80-940(+)